MVTDQNGFPAPRPGNPYFVKGVAFEAATPVNARYRVTALNESMQGIADYLGRFAGAPAQDRTGLAGNYDFHLDFAPDPPAASDPGPEANVQEVPLETLVVDHAERIPTDN